MKIVIIILILIAGLLFDYLISLFKGGNNDNNL